MGEIWKGLERNKLDYILTDLLPYELSERFSYKPFYDFLMDKKNQVSILKIINELRELRAKGNMLFQGSWATTPLKYNIVKNKDANREMSLLQPLSILNIYLFIELYQKDILSYFSKNSIFSLRYHRKKTGLYYKKSAKKIIEYFDFEKVLQMGKKAIQRSGAFFDIVKFQSPNSFIDSQIWENANLRFNYYAFMDYKSCFDSIYSHAYKWIIDSKEAKNSNLFITIDRIIQNINGKSSNGLVVGPEFSRMIAEILLQHIDGKVALQLMSDGINYDEQYVAFRYVDDIFIFASTQEVLDSVIKTFGAIGEMYRMHLNDLKKENGITPYLPKRWMDKTRSLSSLIDTMFYKVSTKEYIELPEQDKHIVKNDFVHIRRIKAEFLSLMTGFPEARRSIVSFLLSTIVNNISMKNRGYKLFSENNIKRSLLLLDLAFFIYVYFPTFESTRKLISLITYMNDEVRFDEKGSDSNQGLQRIIHKYSFIFKKTNLFDICDWFIFMSEYGINLGPSIEEYILKNLDQIDNPLLWADFLVYSCYNTSLHNETLEKVEQTITQKLGILIDKDYILQQEFWYIIIFHNCPHLDKEIVEKLVDIINKINDEATESEKNNDKNRCFTGQLTEMICEFANRLDFWGKRHPESFYNWTTSSDMTKQITYRTQQNTVFRKFKGKLYGMY